MQQVLESTETNCNSAVEIPSLKREPVKCLLTLLCLVVANESHSKQYWRSSNHEKGTKSSPCWLSWCYDLPCFEFIGLICFVATYLIFRFFMVKAVKITMMASEGNKLKQNLQFDIRHCESTWPCDLFGLVLRFGLDGELLLEPPNPSYFRVTLVENVPIS